MSSGKDGLPNAPGEARIERVPVAAIGSRWEGSVCLVVGERRVAVVYRVFQVMTLFANKELVNVQEKVERDIVLGIKKALIKLL